MNSSKSRTVSSEMIGPKTSSKTLKGAPSSPDYLKTSDWKPSTKASPMPEKRIERVADMKQQLNQLQEELKKAKEERSRALKELQEMKKRTQSPGHHGSSPSADRINMLEVEVKKAKESERKMLESMIAQTKLLEQTKISFEEAKLEIRTLQESMRNLESLAHHRSSPDLEKRSSSDVGRAQEEIVMLRNELRLEMQAEEKTKKAMDDLAIVLKEVTTEANQVKLKLSITQSELENARAQAEHSATLLKSSEEKLRVALEDSERLRSEMEELVSSWNAKENGFVECMKVSEEVITKTKQENDKLIDSQRASREENAKLRDILKQAINEASVVKESLEIARNENSLLKDALTEKAKALQSIKQEYESLKVSEASAVGSLNELTGMLEASSAMDRGKIGSSSENGSFNQSKAIVNEVKDDKKMAKFPSDSWRGNNSRIQNGRRHSVGESGMFKRPVFDSTGSPERERDRMFASVSNISDWRVPSSIGIDDRETLNSDDFEPIHSAQFESMYRDTKQKKKKMILRRFGDILRRSFHK